MQNIKIHYGNLHATGSLFDGKYSQCGNSFLPITEGYLEPSRKSTMKFKPLIIFAKSPFVDSDCVLNTPLYYLLPKVQGMSTNRSTKSFFSVKLSDNSKIVIVQYYGNRSKIQRDKLNNRATQGK